MNDASTAAYFPSRGLVAYNVSKSAMIMLTRVLALEWAREGVRVVGIAPGRIDTELVVPIVAWTEKHDMPLNPMRRIGTDTEVADWSSSWYQIRPGTSPASPYRSMVVNCLLLVRNPDVERRDVCSSCRPRPTVGISHANALGDTSVILTA